MNYLGCSGWFYLHWQGLFYPDDLPQKKWFAYYCRHFNTVELNSTFYRWPKESTVKSWYRNSPPDFVYTLKVNKFITHIKKFKNCKKLINDFYNLGESLKEKIGCFLFQLPPSLKYSKEKLKEIINQLDNEKLNAIEFRHFSWFNSEVYDSLKKNHLIYCIVSAPYLVEEFVKTAQDIYLRFHGRTSWYGSNYSIKELKSYAWKIKKLKARNNWIYFNNDAHAYAVKNCRQLKELLTKI